MFIPEPLRSLASEIEQPVAVYGGSTNVYKYRLRQTREKKDLAVRLTPFVLAFSNAQSTKVRARYTNERRKFRSCFCKYSGETS